MRRVYRLAVVAGFVAMVSPARPLAQAPDIPAALSSMRTALGGVAIDAINNFAVTGTSTKQVVNGDQSMALELDCEFPDKFVRRTEWSISGPIEIETILRDGFNGALPINETIQHSSVTMPPPPAGLTNGSSTAPAAAIMKARYTAFARTVVPMLGASPTVAALTFEAASPTTVDGHAADVVVARDGASEVFEIVVDQTSHLPLKVTWTAKPTLMFSSVSTGVAVAVRNGSATAMPARPPASVPPVLPSRHAPPGAVMLDNWPADPGAYAASLPFVQHELVFSQFETVDGVTWPRRWKEYADGKLLEDTRLGKFKINTKIDPRKFEVGK